ncbi:MAG: LysE family translocator [Rhizobiales bacterium]|nr:LysE family translocator [Hyphomicrobiales bacterium]
MTADLFIALVTFAFVSSITPGPNNLMLLASGVNFGFRRTIPHMLGIGVGFTFMVIVVGLGLGELFKAFPAIYTALRVVGGLYMLWLAWKIANSGPVGEGRSAGTPITFIQAALFQWVNPKAWVMAVTAIATYTLPNNYLWSVLLVGLVFGGVNLPSVSTWALFGTALKHVINHPRVLRVFNITMAVLLVLSLAPLVYH